MKLLMLDIGSGLGGASQAMREQGWDVITVDIEPFFNPDVVGDMRSWSYSNERRPDLVWCSPPCTEFAKFAMPCWYNLDELPEPDMSLALGCKRIIDECQPRFWIIENVRGATKFLNPILGAPRIFCPYFLWGFFPQLGNVGRARWGAKTKSLPSTAKAERAKIPYSLSLAIARAITLQSELFSGIAFPSNNSLHATAKSAARELE